MTRMSALVLVFLTASGCSNVMHNLQPHRLWRLNYQEPSGRTDGVYFSLSDPVSSAGNATNDDALPEADAAAQRSERTEFSVGK
jgi:hypothetical protein